MESSCDSQKKKVRKKIIDQILGYLSFCIEIRADYVIFFA